MANTLKYALKGREKLLLTATPLQNSLLELYGLISLIDEHTYGDLKSFREQYANLNQQQTFQHLKRGSAPVLSYPSQGCDRLCVVYATVTPAPAL
jgi:adenine-specific DNA-methyltransferase